MSTRPFIRPQLILVLAALIGGTSSALGLPPARAVSADIVISQVYGGGGNTGAPYSHDFVELFNRGSSPVALSGWSMQYASASGDTWLKTDLSGVIPAGGYYLVREAQGAGPSPPLPAPDAVGTTSMSASSGKVALVTTVVLLTCGAVPGDCFPSGAIRDFVGYGLANNFEGGGSTAMLTNTTAALRGAAGCTDTDQNTTDFSTGPPNPRNSAIPVSPCAPPLRIHTIQGAGHISPLVGSTVTGVEGIVTAKRANGFYMQDPLPDADDRTSEGIFVFTSTAPAVLVGDRVAVSGTVIEFRAGCSATCNPGDSGYVNLSTTQIGSSSITVLSSGNPLPIPVVIGAGGRVPPVAVIEDDTGNVETGTFTPSDGIDFYEALEGMRVQINNAVVVGPRDFAGEIAILADLGAGASLRTPHGGIVVQAGDFNPERIILDNSIVATPPTAKVGDSFPGAAIGVVDYSFATFRFVATSLPPLNPGGLMAETTTAAGLNQLAVATFNLENLDPGDGAAKINGLAGQIVQNLRAPDLIAVQEVQDNNGPTNDGVVDASTTYAALIAAIQAAGGPVYQFRDIPPLDDQDGGEPGGNIRLGFLLRADRGLSFVDRPGGGSTTAVSVVNGPGGPSLSVSPGRIDPTNPAFQGSRKSLAGEFRYHEQTLFVVNNHFISRAGDQPLFGRFQPPTLISETQRIQQAQIVNGFVVSLLNADPNARVIVLGDFNDFEFSAAVTALKGSVLHNLTDSLPPAERYSFIFEGNSQAFDHILVSQRLFNAPFQYDIVHVNAEFATRATDHDPARALFLPPGATATATMTTTGTATATTPATSTPTRSLTATGTPTITATATPTPTVTVTFTRSPTPSPTPSRTATSSPTEPVTSTPIGPTGTPGPGPVSGRSFTLQSGGTVPSGVGAAAGLSRVLSWRRGTQTQSLVVRWSPQTGFQVVDVLPAGVNSLRDDDSLSGSMHCYALVPFLGDLANSPILQGMSDLLCVFPGTKSGASQPTSFRIRLSETTTATLEWAAPGGQNRYELTATRFDGSAVRVVELTGDRLTHDDPTGGLPTCYRLVAFAGATSLGGTDTLCAIPGVAAFPP